MKECEVQYLNALILQSVIFIKQLTYFLIMCFPGFTLRTEFHLHFNG